jgi:hypothetical protein
MFSNEFVSSTNVVVKIISGLPLNHKQLYDVEQLLTMPLRHNQSVTLQKSCITVKIPQLAQRQTLHTTSNLESIQKELLNQHRGAQMTQSPPWDPGVE